MLLISKILRKYKNSAKPELVLAYNFIVKFFVFLLVMFCAGIWLFRTTDKKAKELIVRRSRVELKTFTTQVASSLRYVDDFVKVIVREQEVLDVLLQASPENKEAAYAVLQNFHTVIKASVSYIMDLEGNVIVATNHNAPDSFEGKNYSFRPYFQDALKGKQGGYFAVGVTSGRRGYYSSFPVRDIEGEISGVVVIKKHVESFEQFFESEDQALLVDPHGVIFMSNNSNLLLKSLWPLKSEAIAYLKQSRQFGKDNFEAVFSAEMSDDEFVVLDGRKYLLSSYFSIAPGWSVVMLSSMFDINRYRLVVLGVIFIVVLFVAAIVAVLYVVYVKDMLEKIRSSAKQKSILLQEIHHRVKNNLQIVSSLLNLQSDHIKDKESLTMFKESQNRIRAMALVHEKLYRSADVEQIDMHRYVESLCASLFSSYSIAPGKLNLSIDFNEVFFDIEKAIPCGLILTELISNAFKHAFAVDKAGDLQIGFKRTKDNEYLYVSDSIGAFPDELDFNKTESLGLQLVKTLTLQLGAELKLVNDNKTEFRVIFPL